MLIAKKKKGGGAKNQDYNEAQKKQKGTIFGRYL